MSNNEMPRKGHDQHLCALHGEGLLKDNFEEWKRLVSNEQFVCSGCGRVANRSDTFVILRSLNTTKIKEDPAY